MEQQADVVTYMTLWETLKHDIGVIFEHVCIGLAFVGVTLYFVVQFVGFAVYAILTILVQRDITQWYLGTGRHRR